MLQIISFIGAGRVESDFRVRCGSIFDEEAENDDQRHLKNDQNRNVPPVQHQRRHFSNLYYFFFQFFLIKFDLRN